MPNINREVGVLFRKVLGGFSILPLEKRTGGRLEKCNRNCRAFVIKEQWILSFASHYHGIKL